MKLKESNKRFYHFDDFSHQYYNVYRVFQQLQIVRKTKRLYPPNSVKQTNDQGRQASVMDLPQQQHKQQLQMPVTNHQDIHLAQMQHSGPTSPSRDSIDQEQRVYQNFKMRFQRDNSPYKKGGAAASGGMMMNQGHPMAQAPVMAKAAGAFSNLPHPPYELAANPLNNMSGGGGGAPPANMYESYQTNNQGIHNNFDMQHPMMYHPHHAPNNQMNDLHGRQPIYPHGMPPPQSNQYRHTFQNTGLYDSQEPFFGAGIGGIHDISPLPHNHSRFDSARISRGPLFDVGLIDSSNCGDDEDDEDYSIQEDLKKNKKRYKNDEEWTQKAKFIVPKSELMGLKEDLNKDIQDYPNYGMRKRPMDLSYQDQQRESQSFQMYKRWKPNNSLNASAGLNSTPLGGISLQANASAEQMLSSGGRFNQNAANQLLDSVLTNNPSGVSQQNSYYRQPPTNMQNNYYYNFNNNFHGPMSNQNPPPPNEQSVSSSHNGGYYPPKQVKSIEIQVTPEKLKGRDDEDEDKGLGAAGGVGTGNSDKDHQENKKRRRRRKGNELVPAYKFEQGYPTGWPQNGYYGNFYARYPPPPPYFNPYPQYVPPPQQPVQPPQQQSHLLKLLPDGHLYPPSNPALTYYTSTPTPSSSANNEQQFLDYVKKAYFPFNNEQLRELVNQIEIYVQMLYQALLFQRQKTPTASMQQFEDMSLSSMNKAVNGKEGKKGLALVAHKDKVKYKAYCNLYEMSMKKDQIVKSLGLPTYKVSLDSIRPPKKKFSDDAKRVVLNLCPQVSYFQSPLLEFFPDVIRHLPKVSTASQTTPPSVMKEQNKHTIKFLKKYSPVINPYLLPINPFTEDPAGIQNQICYFGKRVQESMEEQKQQVIGSHKSPLLQRIDPRNKKPNKQPDDEDDDFQEEELDDVEILNVHHLQLLPGSQINHRRKFTMMDDNLLLLGLRQYGYKDVDSIKKNWLPSKTQNEIKHRYKNLTATKSPNNFIKKWKNNFYKPLNEREMMVLAKAVRWFGPSVNNRWPLICKCFLPNRSPHYLKVEYQNIVSDHERTEKFGKMMLMETGKYQQQQQLPADQDEDALDEGEERFEDIDFENMAQQKKGGSCEDLESQFAAVEEFMKMQQQAQSRGKGNMGEDEENAGSNRRKLKEMYKEEESSNYDDGEDDNSAERYEVVELM